MELSVSQQGGYVLAKATGAIDDSAAEPFRELLYPLVQTHNAKVVLDLSDSPRINSMGIGRLVGLVNEAKESNSRVVVAAPTEFVAGALRVARIDKVMDIADTVEEAVAHLTGT